MKGNVRQKEPRCCIATARIRTCAEQYNKGVWVCDVFVVWELAPRILLQEKV